MRILLNVQYLISTLKKLKTENDIALQLAKFVFLATPPLFIYL